MEIGLSPRQALLLNGILFNSEAWHGITEKEIKRLEEVDEHLLRSLVHGHAKTPLEFLFLQTGAIPIRYVIACRRNIYLQTILKRNDGELRKRVYMTQKEFPTHGDFYNLVNEDFEAIGEPIDENIIIATAVPDYKKIIKLKVQP